MRRGVNRYMWGDELAEANASIFQGYTGPFAKHKGANHKLLARHLTPVQVAAMRETHIGATTVIGDSQWTIADIYTDDLRRVIGVCVPVGTYVPPMATAIPDTSSGGVDDAVNELLALMSAESVVAAEEEVYV